MYIVYMYVVSHLRQLAVRARQRLGFLNKASHILDSKARCTVYKGFVRPVLEYCPLVWLGASATSLGQLDSIQRRALNIIGPGAYLPSCCGFMITALNLIYH